MPVSHVVDHSLPVHLHLHKQKTECYQNCVSGIVVGIFHCKFPPKDATLLERDIITVFINIKHE